MKKKEQTIIYFRESLFQSICSDSLSYGFLFATYWLNYTFIEGNNFVDFILLIIFILFTVAKATGKAKKFTSKEKFKKYIEETL
jgi:hypothetical protein